MVYQQYFVILISALHDITIYNEFFQDLRLQDEVRLDKIKFSNEADGEFPDLQPLEQAVVLGVL